MNGEPATHVASPLRTSITDENAVNDVLSASMRCSFQTIMVREETLSEPLLSTKVSFANYFPVLVNCVSTSRADIASSCDIVGAIGMMIKGTTHSARVCISETCGLA